jgi:hypothetical protein
MHIYLIYRAQGLGYPDPDQDQARDLVSDLVRDLAQGQVSDREMVSQSQWKRSCDKA